MPALQQAIEQFRAVEPKEAQAALAAGRPLAEALADLDEALDRGRAEVEKARRRLDEEHARVLAADLAALDALFARHRWLLAAVRPPLPRAGPRARPAPGPRDASALFDALLEGYGLIQNRLAAHHEGRADPSDRVRRASPSIPSG